jgi:hypothetical protein
MTGESGKPMATPSVFSIELSIEGEVGSGQDMTEESLDVFFKVTS